MTDFGMLVDAESWLKQRNENTSTVSPVERLCNDLVEREREARSAKRERQRHRPRAYG